MNIAYALSAFAGLRPGEVRARKWPSVDLRARKIYVRESVDGPTKDKDARVVPIVDGLAQVLTAWPEESGQAGGSRGYGKLRTNDQSAGKTECRMPRMDRVVRWATVLPFAALACGASSVSSSSSDGAGFGGAAAGSGTAGSGGASQQVSSSVSLEGSPLYTRVQRLTNTQWRNAVTDILRLEAPASLGADLRAPPPGTEFTNNEKVLYVSAQDALDFETGSEAAAALATGTESALARLYSGTDRAGFVSALGRRAFRRPLSADEQAKYERVFALGEELYGAGFAQGAALVIRALLVSPHFLYRTELGPIGEPLSGYEAASKLSFWLVGTTPSDALLDSAAAGELDSADGLERLARQMLGQPHAVEVARDFHAQAFRLNRYPAIAKNVPGYDDAVSAEAAAASSRFFDRVFEGGEGLREILTSPRAFVGPRLAPLYGMAPPDAIEERTLDAARAGYFLQVPFLLLFSNNEQPGTIGRGIALSDEVLCDQLPAENADIPPVPTPAAGETNRDRIERFTADCGTCHKLFINPLGFAFEAFDGLGRWRALDNNKPVDSSGSYPFADGSKSFADARELVQIMADTTQAHTCYAKKITGYALQRDIVEADRPLLGSLSEVSRNGSLKELVISVVRAPAFRLRAEGRP